MRSFYRLRCRSPSTRGSSIRVALRTPSGSESKWKLFIFDSVKSNYCKEVQLQGRALMSSLLAECWSAGLRQDDAPLGSNGMNHCRRTLLSSPVVVKWRSRQMGRRALANRRRPEPFGLNPVFRSRLPDRWRLRKNPLLGLFTSTGWAFFGRDG